VGFYGGFSWDFDGISLGFYGGLMGFQWNFIGILWWFNGISMGLTRPGKHTKNYMEKSPF